MRPYFFHWLQFTGKHHIESRVELLDRLRTPSLAFSAANAGLSEIKPLTENAIIVRQISCFLIFNSLFRVQAARCRLSDGSGIRTLLPCHTFRASSSEQICVLFRNGRIYADPRPDLKSGHGHEPRPDLQIPVQLGLPGTVSGRGVNDVIVVGISQ
jgi:hypothetical protein